MNKDDIKKALGQCSDNCIYCPYRDENKPCQYLLKKDALNLITEQENEIAQLKADNARLTAKLGQVLLSIDTVKEMNAMCNIDEQRKRAVQDFAEELKAKTMCIKEYEDGTRILQTSNKLIDQSVKIFLDELLKEYE